MSFFAKVGVIIQDVALFKKACKEHGIDFELNKNKQMRQGGAEVYGIMTDTKVGSYGRRSQAYLVKDGDGYRMIVDNDPRYSSITSRLGRNGGKLMRQYTQNVISKGVRRKGGRIRSVREQEDGSIVMKIAAMG